MRILAGHRAGLVPITVALAATVAIVACGPVDKQRAVQAVATAARQSEPRTGTLSITSRPRTAIALPGTGGQPGVTAPAASARPTPTRVSLPMIVDPGRQRSALLATAAAAARLGPSPSGGLPALALFDGGRVYVRSPDAGQVGARPWLSLDTDAVGPVSTPETQQLSTPRTIGDLVVVSPLVLREAAFGLLTGSVELRGTVDLTAPDGRAVRANAYAGNTSLDKAARALHRDPDSVRPTRHLLESFAVHDDINPMSVWLDVNGHLSRIEVAYAGRPQRGVRIDVDLDMQLNPRGAVPVPTDVLEAPPVDQVVQVSSIEELKAALDQWSQLGAGAAAGASQP